MKSTIGSVQASLFAPECATIQKQLDEMLRKIDRAYAASLIEDEKYIVPESQPYNASKLATLMRIVESGLTQLDQSSRSGRVQGETQAS